MPEILDLSDVSVVEEEMPMEEAQPQVFWWKVEIECCCLGIRSIYVCEVREETWVKAGNFAINYLNTQLLKHPWEGEDIKSVTVTRGVQVNA